MKRTLIAFGLLFFFVLNALAQETHPDLILYNGKIFTGNPQGSFVEAVAVEGKLIKEAGSNKKIREMAGPATRLIDLGGRTVTPGFNDAHIHFMPDPKGFYLRLSGPDPDWDETAEVLAKAVKEVKKGEWLFGTVGPRVVLDPKITRFVLDKIAPDHPVLLRAYYGHGYIANTTALPLLGIAKDQPDPVGGIFERTKNSTTVNGRMWEYAQWTPARKLSDSVPDEEIITQLRAMADEAKEFGVTSLQVMASINAGRFAELAAKADLPVRVRAMSFGLSTPTGRDLSEIPDGTRIGDKTVLSGIKWVLDGTPIEHGAAVRKPYADAPNSRGLLNFSAAEIRKMLEESLRADQQLLLHCSGDRCAETVLDEMKSLGADVDWPAKRVRIEHGDGLTDDLLQAAKKMGVIVVQNPTHFSLDAVPASRYGKDAHFFPLRTYFDLGMHAALGSDGPMNPFLNIMLATIHPRRPSEAISRETAVRAYTYGSAFAEFAETRKGTIASGQLADIVVLSQDIFEVPVEALPGTRSVLTIVGGKIVFDPGTLKE